MFFVERDTDDSAVFDCSLNFGITVDTHALNSPLFELCSTLIVSRGVTLLPWEYMKSIIVAFDKNHGIGAANDLLWTRDLPADLRHFKDITTGHPIIMGNNTYKSLGRPLPNRQNIVISRDPTPIEGFTVVGDLDAAYKAANDDDVYVIGGGQIYALALDTVDQLLVTEVDETFAAEVFFPKIDSTVWQEVSREHHDKDEANKYNYDFVVYRRR